MVHIYLLTIWAVEFGMFDLVPSVHRVGGILWSDLSLALICLGLVYYALKGNVIRPLRNFFTWYILCYLLMVMVQVSIAAFKYSQPIIDGIIVARYQLHYLSFPLFLLALDNLDKMKTFMSALSALAIIIIALSMINYFGVTVFYGRFAHGHGMRSGILRAYIPAMDILVIGALWQFWGYLKENRFFSWQLAFFLVIYGGIIFRQTRGRIIAVTVVLAAMLVAKRRHRTLIVATVIAASILLLSSMTSDGESLFVNAFESAYTEMAEDEGTWAVRMQWIRQSWDVFVNNLFTGSGGLVIRAEGGGWRGWGELLDVALNTDLGYWVYLKFFGYPGVLYIVVLVLGFYWYVLRGGTAGENGHIAQFAAYLFLYILISLVTVNYLTRSDGILTMCLTWAILVKAVQTKDLAAATAPYPIHSTGLSVSDHSTAERVPKMGQRG